MKLDEIILRLENAKKYLDNTANRDLSEKLIELESGSNIGKDVREALKATGFSPPKDFYTDLKKIHNFSIAGQLPLAETQSKKIFLSWIDDELTKIKTLKTRFPNQERELGFENGKIYDVRIKTAQEEADRALKSVKDEIDKTPVSDRPKLDQLEVRYRSLGTAKQQLSELNDQFATNPSALNPAELRRVTESVKEFASNPKLTSADQVSYAKAAVPSGAQAASAETPTTASGLKPTSASLLRPQDTAGASVSASKPATVSGVRQAAVPTSTASSSSKGDESASNPVKSIIGSTLSAMNNMLGSKPVAQKEVPSGAQKEVPSGNIPSQSPQAAAAQEIANQRASQKGLGTFTASKDDTVLEALPPNLLIKLYDSLNQPHVDYGQGLIPNMDPAEINGMRKLNDLVNNGDPEAIALLNELKQNQPEKFNTFQTVRTILQDTKLSPEDKERFLRSSAELTGQGASPVTPQDTQPYDKSMEVLRERLRNRIFEDFKKNDLRKFQDMFTGNQSYFGSRRKEIEKDLMQSLQEKLADVDASLGVQGEQKAYDRALADKMRKLQGASQFGGLNAQTANTALASNAQDIARAQALNASSLAERQQELMRQNLRKALAHDSTLTGLRANEALMQAGGVQRKNQEEINKDLYKQFTDKVNHQRNSAIAMLDAARGYQMAPTNMPMMNAATVNSNLMASAQPQQVYNANNNGIFGPAANLMGSLDKALNPQNLPRFKSGGVVKRPAYAVGGSVADDIMRQKRALIAKQMAQPPVDPYQQFMSNTQNVSNQLMNRAQNPGSPSGAFLRDFGANLMAADPSKTATQQVGEALKSGHAAYDTMEAQPGKDIETALAYQQVMHNTKKAVDEFKANQDIKKEELNLKREDQNLKRATMAAMMGYGSGDQSLAEFDAKGKPTARGKTLAKLDDKVLAEAHTQVNASEGLMAQLDTLRGLIKNVHSGPYVAKAAEWHPKLASWIGGGKEEDIASMKALTMSIITTLEQMNPGRTLAARLELLKQSKMGIHVPKETNQKLLDELSYIKEMIMNRGMFVQKAYKQGVHALEAESAYNDYIDAITSGKTDVTPLDFLDVSEDKKSKIPFKPLENYVANMENNKFASDEDLQGFDKQKSSNKKNQKSNDNAKTFTMKDAEAYAKDQGISKEEAIKMYTASGWILKDN